MRNGGEGGEDQGVRNHDGGNVNMGGDPHRTSDGTQETNIGERVQPSEQPAQCHIFTYESPWKVYALGYSWRQDQPFRFGLGSFLDDKTNKVFSLLTK